MLTAFIELDAFNDQFTVAVRSTIRDGARDIIQAEAARLRREVGHQFGTEGRFGGTPWPGRRSKPHAPPDTRPLLQRTGLLLASLTEEFHPAHVERLDVDARGIPYLVFGSRVQYATWHQFGTRRLPQRQMLTASMLGGKARDAFPL